MGGQRHAPAALPPGKTQYPLYRRLGEPQGRSGQVRKISPPPRFDPRTVQPVASRYTDCAISAPTGAIIFIEKVDISLLCHYSKRDLCFGRQSLISPALAPSLCDLTHFQVDRSQNTTIDSGSAVLLPFNGLQFQRAMKQLNYDENSSKLYVRSLLATKPDFAMTW